MIKTNQKRASPRLADDTRTRILDTAERLFAERGIDTVSVRAILAEAGVNVALAHYHFGNREGLIKEFLDGRVMPLIEELLAALEEVDARGPRASVEDVLRAFFTPTARWIVAQPHRGRLLAQIQVSPNPEIRELGHNSLRKVLRRLGDAMGSRMPGPLDLGPFFLRYYLVIGSWAYLSSTWEDFGKAARRHFGPEAVPDVETLIDQLVAFSAAGIRAGSAAGKDKRA